MSDLKDQVIKANAAYRAGTPIIADEEYDILLGNLEDEMGIIEFECFKETLMEDAGSFQHDYVIGSLNKVKYGEGELAKWIVKHNVKQIVLSEKLDGCSFVACYKAGKFVSGASRGDGTSGTDWTAKMKYILPQTLDKVEDLVIRGELVLLHGVPELLGMKNARNGVVGIMNEDKIVPYKLTKVTALVYDILNLNLNAVATFQEIGNNFQSPNHQIMDVTSDLEERLKTCLITWKKTSNYLMDGIVLSPVDYVNENVYHPERKIAFKVNSEGVWTTVVGIEWNISKGGKMVPVVLLEPKDIDGVTVKRATGNNAKYILDNKIQVGVEVAVIKSGEIIPKIVNIRYPK